MSRLQDLIEHHAGGLSPSHLLDLGCGDGAATRRLLHAGVRPRRVTGVDPEDAGFSPELPVKPSPDHIVASESWSFVNKSAHEVLYPKYALSDKPEMIVLGRMLHHVPRFGDVIYGVSSVLRETAGSGGTPAWLILWEPVAAEGPFSMLHQIKTDVDRELGIPHRRPFTREVLERVLLSRAGNDGVTWHVIERVQASREPYTDEEYRSELANIREYITHVRDRPRVYAELTGRLSRLPATSGSQPFGEPVLLAVAEFR